MPRNRIFIGVEVREAFSGTANPIICPLKQDTAVVYDGHHHLYEIMRKGAGRCLAVHQLDFVSITYCEEHSCLFILSSDGNLHVYNSKTLHFLTRLPMSIRHGMEIRYVNRTKQLLVWMPSEFLSLSVSITTNHKTARFASSMYFVVQQTLRTTIPFPAFMKYFSLQREEYLVMNSLTDVMVYNCSSRKLQVDMRQLTTSIRQLTAVAVSPRKNYLLFGCQSGQIMVYELNSNHHLINELEGHRRRVLALHVNQPDSELVSYGEDETIRICSLDSLQTLEVFEVGRKFHKFEFLSADAFLACQGSTTYVGEISSKLQLIYEHRSQLECSVSSGNDQHLLVMNSNTMIGLDEGTLKVQKGYTPPNCKQVLQVDHNPFVSGLQYWILTSEKELYVYNLEGNNATPFTVVTIHPAKEFINIAGNVNTFDLLTFRFVNIAPLRFDAEIKQSTHLSNLQSPNEFQAIAFGSKRGDLVVVSSLKSTYIQSRVRFHKEEIKAIEQLTDNNGDTLILTLCAGHRIVVGKLAANSEPEVITQLDLSTQFVRMFFDYGYLVLTYQQGAFDLCQYQNGQLLTRKGEQSKIQHDDLIVFASVSKNCSRLVTSSLDHTVKVWTLNGGCLFQVVVGGMVDWVRLNDDKLLMMVNGGWLVWLSDTHYKQYSAGQSKKLISQISEKQPVRQRLNELFLPSITPQSIQLHARRRQTRSGRRRDFSNDLLKRQRTKSNLYNYQPSPQKSPPTPKIPNTTSKHNLPGYESYFHLPDQQFIVKLTRNRNYRRQ